MTRWRETLRPMLEAAYEGASLKCWWESLDRRGVKVVDQILLFRYPRLMAEDQ